MKEETGISILSIINGPIALLTLFSLSGLLSSVFYPTLASVWFFSLTFFCSDSHYPKIAGCFRSVSASEIASDAYSAASCWAVISSLNTSHRPNRAFEMLSDRYWRHKSCSSCPSRVFFRQYIVINQIKPQGSLWKLCKYSEALLKFRWKTSILNVESPDRCTRILKSKKVIFDDYSIYD